MNQKGHTENIFNTRRPRDPTMMVKAPPVGRTSTAPTTIGMQSLGVEVFSLPVGCWFLAAAGATFEVQPGDRQL